MHHTSCWLYIMASWVAGFRSILSQAGPCQSPWLYGCNLVHPYSPFRTCSLLRTSTSVHETVHVGRQYIKKLIFVSCFLRSHFSNKSRTAKAVLLSTHGHFNTRGVRDLSWRDCFAYVVQASSTPSSWCQGIRRPGWAPFWRGACALLLVCTGSPAQLRRE